MSWLDNIKRTLRRVIRIEILRMVLIVSLTMIIAFPLVNIVLIYPAFAEQIIATAEVETTRLGRHIAEELFPADTALHEQLATAGVAADLESFRQTFQLVKIKVFAASGEVLYSTVESDIGEMNEHDYFYDTVSAGTPFTKLVRENSTSGEGQTMTVDVIETYVPIMRSGTFVGAIEIYQDISARLIALDLLTRRSDMIQLIPALGFLAMIVAIAVHMIRTQETNDWLVRALEQSPTTIMVTDTDGKVVYANTSFEALSGFTPAEVTGRIPPLLEPTRHAPETYRLLRRAIAGGGEWQGEVLSHRKDGYPYEEAVAIVPILNPEGEFSRALIVREDITNRKQAERDVRREKEYFQALLQNNPLAIVALDLQSRVAACNHAFETLYGYSQAEAVGQDLDTLIAPALIDAEAKAYTKRVRSGEVIHSQTQRRRKDGSLVDIELFGVPVVVDGEQVGMLGLYQDVSERLRTEAARQRAIDAAEAATRAKSEFLANMSHEIRTPLNAVIGMTGLLLDAELSLENRDFVETIRSSGDALLSLINDILDFSKIEAGRLSLEEHPFTLRDCIEDSLDLLAPAAGKKGLDLIYDIEPGVPEILIGDVTRVRQVLVNLLGNAVKFTAAGEIVVLVDGCFLENGSYKVHVAVRDSGIGIPADRIEQLFESFSQADASTTRKYGGTGLGLTISKRLVEMMGGSMEVESEVGRGSTFHFTVIVRTDSAHSPVAPLPQTALVGRRLLIVDDSPANRTILLRQAESWGMAATAVASARAALEVLAPGTAYDLGIIDMQMPEMDGAELARRIRETRTPAQLPLVMLTSLGSGESDSAGGLYNAFLTKPVKPALLRGMLVKVLSGTQQSADHRPVKKPLHDTTLGQRHPLRILLAEDNLVNQKVAVRILARLGYRTDVAADGREVLAALSRQTYDVILMDVQMPEMDGEQATMVIRSTWPADRQPYIIAMTANALNGDRERYLDCGMDDYVSKPVHVENLIAALEKCPAQTGIAAHIDPLPLGRQQ